MISAEEKSKLQVLGRRHETEPPGQGGLLARGAPSGYTSFGHYRRIARSFQWAVTRTDLERVLERVDTQAQPPNRVRDHLRLVA